MELASLGYDLALVARDAAALAEVIAALPESERLVGWSFLRASLSSAM